MKICFALCACFLIPFTMLAQRFPTGKGTFRSGGGFSFGFSNEVNERIYKFNFTPRIGYFVTDNLLIGGITNYTLQVGTEETLLSAIKFTPEVKYYWKLKPGTYLLGTVQYTIDRRSDFTAAKTVDDNSTIGAGPGITYFFSRRIGFEFNILYTQYIYPDEVFSKVNTDFGFIFHILDKSGKFSNPFKDEKPEKGDKNDYERELYKDDLIDE